MLKTKTTNGQSPRRIGKRKTKANEQVKSEKKICIENKRNSNTNMWPNDTTDAESIFSDLTLSVDNEKDNCSLESDYNKQCSQKFFSDINNSFINDDYRSQFYPVGSQYTTRQTYKICDENKFDCINDITWSTQGFDELSFPSKGPFYNLPSEVKELIFQHKKIKSLYARQTMLKTKTTNGQSPRRIGKRKTKANEQVKSEKKICIENKRNSNTNMWPNDTTDAESIFSDLTLSVDNEKDNCSLESDYNKQCSQKFFSDINNSFINDDYRSQFYPVGSQYTTRQTYKICDENKFDCINDITWSTQGFDELSFPSKGPFYNLPSEVKELIFQHKKIKSLYEWQDECLRLDAIKFRRNLLYALPTSGGKTLVAEILMLRELICREKNVMFILPYVSIVQEKVRAMSPFALKLDFLIEEYTAGKGRIPPPKRRKRKSIFISSIEKAAILFDSLIEAQRANEIGLVVVDEMHLIGEKGRGSTLESILTKVMYLKAGTQIVGMSATIGNLPDLSEFLNADIYTRGFRPVELKEYIKCGSDIMEINISEKSVEDIFTLYRTVDFKYSNKVKATDPDHLAGLVSEIIPDESCLIFCPTRKNCESVALLLSQVLQRNKFTEHKKHERISLIDAIEKICGVISPVLNQTIPYGIAYHHSGLTIDERRILETAYHYGTISVICCTSTLAAGVNLPAKLVIIRAPYVGNKFITLCQYKQMIGRAGRAGMGNAGQSILICSSKDNVKVREMLFSPMDEVNSTILDEDSYGLQLLLLSSIGLGIAECLRDLINLVKCTLASVQAERKNIFIDAEIMKVLKIMFKYKILYVATKNSSFDEIVTTQEIQTPNISIINHKSQSKSLVISKTTKIQLSNIGKAAFKAGVDFKRAENIYNDLKKAQRSLVLTNYCHLLYHVISFASNDELVLPEPAILYREYNNLPDDIQYLASVIGLKENVFIKMAKTMSVKGSYEIQLIRFFKVMILNEIMNLEPLHKIAAKFCVERGVIQNLITQTISATGSVIRLCEQLDEFWCYTTLFEKLSQKLDYCCTAELIPLLQLPAVKINRAKQLYSVGYKTLEDLAKSNPKDLVDKVEHMNRRLAREIISAAKMILLDKLDTLQEETEVLINCLNVENARE